MQTVLKEILPKRCCLVCLGEQNDEYQRINVVARFDSFGNGVEQPFMDQLICQYFVACLHSGPFLCEPDKQIFQYMTRGNLGLLAKRYY